MLMDADWRLDAACQGKEHVFWGDDTVMTAPSTGTARAVCARCPVTEPCLAEALARTDPDDWGIWGGDDTARTDRDPPAATAGGVVTGIPQACPNGHDLTGGRVIAHTPPVGGWGWICPDCSISWKETK